MMGRSVASPGAAASPRAGASSRRRGSAAGIGRRPSSPPIPHVGEQLALALSDAAEQRLLVRNFQARVAALEASLTEERKRAAELHAQLQGGTPRGKAAVAGRRAGGGAPAAWLPAAHGLALLAAQLTAAASIIALVVLAAVVLGSGGGVAASALLLDTTWTLSGRADWGWSLLSAPGAGANLYAPAMLMALLGLLTMRVMTVLVSSAALASRGGGKRGATGRRLSAGTATLLAFTLRYAISAVAGLSIYTAARRMSLAAHTLAMGELLMTPRMAFLCECVTALAAAAVMRMQSGGERKSKGE